MRVLTPRLRHHRLDPAHGPRRQLVTLGEDSAGSTATTSASRSAATLSLTSTWPRARIAPDSSSATSSIAARFAGSAYAARFATSSVYEVSSVSRIRSPFLRSEEPVSVRSTMASTMSGTFASVAPYDGTTTP
jgi:hypothetical protein